MYWSVSSFEAAAEWLLIVIRSGSIVQRSVCIGFVRCFMLLLVLFGRWWKQRPENFFWAFYWLSLRFVSVLSLRTYRCHPSIKLFLSLFNFTFHHSNGSPHFPKWQRTNPSANQIFTLDTHQKDETNPIGSITIYLPAKSNMFASMRRRAGAWRNQPVWSTKGGLIP